MGKQERPNPYLTANIFSKLSFWWLLEIFRLGKNNKLREENLYDALPSTESKALGDRIEKLWKNELIESERRKRKPSFGKVIINMFFWEIVKQGISGLTSNICKIVQPLLLAQVILYFNPLAKVRSEEAYVYGSGLILVTILQMVILRQQLFSQFKTGMGARIACSSLLYRKTLKLSCASSGLAVNGLIINMMSNDLAKLEKFFIFCHFLWLMPLLMILVSYLLWRQLGNAAFAGILTVIAQIVPIQVIWYKVASKLRLKSAARIDKRVLLIGEIINGMRVIKMYAWEKYFEKLVHLAREREIDTLLKLAYLRSTNLAMSVFTDRTALFCTIAVYVWLGDVVTADKIFSTVHYFVLIRQITARLFPEAVFYASATSVALKRMEEFLTRAEIESQDNTATLINGNAVVIKQVDAMWASNPRINHICDMSLHLVPNKLYAVVGPVGSGKSSLLKLILGELQAKSGHVSVHGKVSFASQEPWLFAGSVRDNIVFGEEYNKDRYNNVVKVCQLARDFGQLPFGDRTLVGERGMSLSGGQCARVNLARAVYRNADVYLFDDPLSAVDSHVGKHLFEDCIAGFLKMKTRILVTHQVQYLQHTDGIIVLNHGQIEFQGNYKSFIAANKCLEHLSMSNEEEQKPETESSRRNSQTSIYSIKLDNCVDAEPKETQEMLFKGQGNKVLLIKYFKAAGSYFTFGSTMLLFVITQLVVSAFEYWLSYWTNQEDKRLERMNKSNEANSSRTTAAGPASLENPSSDEYLSSETALCVSGGLVIAIVLLCNLKNFWFFKHSLSSSKSIHNDMFSRLLRAPMQFFNVNASGRMLNRFSKDTGTADDDMPNAMMEVMERGLAIIAVFIQIIVINWWTVAPLLIVGYLCIKLNEVYLVTAQALKRLEGNAKSPVFSLINTTLLGLPTIRACRAESLVSRNFDERQDAHTAAQYLCQVITVAYGMWLDLMASTFLGFMVYTFIPLKSERTMGGDVGLALTQFLSICSVLQYVMRQFAELMTQMTALERMFQYTELEQEGPFETELEREQQLHDEAWPDKGQIKFQNLSLRYSRQEQPVLKNLNFTIEANTKVGVVGRTGAGKSSLIAALFRLSGFEGSLSIDDVDTKQIGLLNLRSKISIIPQEPTLFTTSLRDNLDPLGQYEDAALWSALRDVEMHGVFDSLQQPIDANLSAGQRQLLCLARAIVRRNKILLLDEATANVDLTTDELIQTTIRSKFKHCTVLTIAHRLNTIMDSDAILVMDAGRVLEFDQPHKLLRKNNGYFSRIVEESGNARNLKKIANKAYDISPISQPTDTVFTNEIDETTRL